ncbi:MAG: integrase [Nitrosomonadales bacterium]|nr:integrase [Nitrosomonadales bacterium]
MIIEVYDAFKSAGASDEKAQAAAKALADYDSRFNKIDGSLEALRAEVTGLRWMMGITVALNISIIGLIVNNLLNR